MSEELARLINAVADAAAGNRQACLAALNDSAAHLIARVKALEEELEELKAPKPDKKKNPS